MSQSNAKNRLPIILLITILFLLTGLILYTVISVASIPKLSEAIEPDTAPLHSAAVLRTTVPATPTPAPTAALVPAAEETEEDSTVETPFWADGILSVGNTYRSPTLSVKVSTVVDTKSFSRRVKYYVADIRVSDVTQIRTAHCKGDFSKPGHGNVRKMAKTANALVAISGDYCGFRRDTLVIRNGIVYRQKISYDDVCLLLRNGEMETIRNKQADIGTILEKDPWQAWEFGPALIEDDGSPRTSFGTNTLIQKNPRSCIGYIEPGHYLFLVADGRQKASRGLSLQELARLMHDLGCRQAFNLDGGASAHFYWNDNIFNNPCNGGREISDIIYVEKEAYPACRLFGGKGGI